MQLRRFTADTTPAALGAVRLALGEDAIILANRKIGEQVEIIATGQMDDAQSLSDMSLESVSQQSSSEGGATAPNSGSRSAEPTSFDELTAAIDAVDEAKPYQMSEAGLSANNRNNVTNPSNRISAESDLHKPDRQLKNGKPVRLVSHENESAVPRRPPSTKRDNASNVAVKPEKSAFRAEIEALSADFDHSIARHTDELVQIISAQSGMINEYFKGLEVNLWGNNSPNRTLHLQRLFSLGIGAELAIKLVERANPKHSVDDALRQSFALLKSTLPIGVDKTFSVPGVTVFSGLPGAGKTTALMKIATQHVKEEGSDSIVVICADTRRIGAFEELQAYGRLLGVPTVHAHDSLELESLLEAFTHKKLVLIDHTLPMDNDAVELPKRLLKPAVRDSVRQLLVLSATAQSSTVDSLITRHCHGRSMQCVLTHLDGSARLGETFNALIRHHLPIAYWSDNASVQHPLQKAEASVLIATAVAMSKRLQQTPDDEWLLRLVQPSDGMMPQPTYKKTDVEVCA